MTDFVERGSVFRLGGGRELLNGSRTKELLAEIALKDPSHVVLSNKSFTEEAALAIAESLREFKNVTILDYSDIIAGRPEAEGFQVLTILGNCFANANIEELHVSDNALGPRGILAFNPVLKCKSLQKLFVCNNGMSAESVFLLRSILLGEGAEANPPPLIVLEFYNNMSGDKGAVYFADIVRACPGLSKLRFSATRSGAEGCSAISQAIASLSLLESLDVSDNSFGMKAGASLVDAISRQTRLTHLNLRDAGIGGAACATLLRHLEPRVRGIGEALLFLDLSGNDFTESLCSAFENSAASVAKTNNGSALLPVLEELHLDDNDIGSEGISAVARALRIGFRTIDSGVLAESAATLITEDGAVSSAAARASHHTKEITYVFCPRLKLLSACACEVTAIGASRLCRVLARRPLFRLVRLDGNQISESCVAEITELLKSVGKNIDSLEDNDVDADDDLDEVDDEISPDEEQGDLEALVDAISSAKI